MKRICNICKTEKEITDFYRDRNSSGGRMYRCKLCDKIKNRKWQRESGYNSRRDKYESQIAQRSAKAKVKGEIDAGRMKRASDCYCIDCGKAAQEYHHWSYDRKYWLDVVPLCRSCHRKKHDNQCANTHELVSANCEIEVDVL